ncbi:MAG: DUF1501 domain-containing protein [Verrucomicrobiaceae bacterium]|nr:DUF1501 domain-containing protein [Verrucomicrobiaceae bacterium]
MPAGADLSSEPESVRRVPGLDHQTTSRFGKDCLLARRLVERGVPSSRSVSVAMRAEGLGCP